MAAPRAAGLGASGTVVRLADYRRNAWLPHDDVWESATLAGVEALMDGDLGAAGALLGRVRRIAERELAADDPRLAASRTNLARWLRRRRDRIVADRLLAEAIATWELVPAWLDRLAVGDTALTAPQCHRLADEGRRHAVALAQQRTVLLPCGLERWRGRGAPGPGDRRKLLAAVFLSTFRLAPRP
jgi:hypothetical protein